MAKKRTMAVVGAKISFAEAEDSDLIFWADKSCKERLQEVERLRRMIWTYVLGNYPDKMEKTGAVMKKSILDE